MFLLKFISKNRFEYFYVVIGNFLIKGVKKNLFWFWFEI